MADPMNEMNQKVIDEFRSNGGAVGGMFEGMPMALVHHVGAKSGTERVQPLACPRDGDNYVLIASKGGAPDNPAWYHNLKANPETTIEVGTETIPVTATEAEGAERDRIYAQVAQALPQFAEYEQKTSRTIPVLVLAPR